ncbi:MAG: Flp pilus assembly complex ATPase component [Desulfobacteraceae bacterium]|nr:Flp pilus assembly complex ATPase component [Desulfobacteraceae bacterium]
MKNNKVFMDLLISTAIITSDDAIRLLDKFHQDAYDVLVYLQEGNVAPKDTLGKLWGDSLKIAYVNLDKTIFESRTVKKLPGKIARKQRIIPLYQMGDTVTVAIKDPRDKEAVDYVQKAIGQRVSVVFSFVKDIEDAIEIQYQSKDTLEAFVTTLAHQSLFKGTSKITSEQISRLAGEKSIVELVRGIMLLGVKERASDIHIEPQQTFVRVRFRIDGDLLERLKLDNALLPPLVSRLKILSKLDITERRQPQDGRISLKLANKSIDFRLSTVPTIQGEKIVMRILSQTGLKEVPDLEALDFSKKVLHDIRQIIDTPNGVFFVTGPTGSGKTTTLYAILNELNTPQVNITTVEDPVEYRLPGITQVQVNHNVDLDFARCLRAFLRQDPDVILIGEIRDLETAKVSSQAALTGHLVLATMHTNSALQAVTRLVEIGVEPFLVAPSIIGVMAQRLVRRICPHCREPYELTMEKAQHYFTNFEGEKIVFFKGTGCPECNHTGFLGRLAIHELFIMTEKIRSMVSKGVSILQIEEYARQTGFHTMRYDGIKKVLRGLTTIDEIERVTSMEPELTT